MFQGFPALDLSASGTKPRRRSGVVDAPFMIYTAGRSRTAWLSVFLTYGEYACHNEIGAAFRSWHEVSAFFSNGIGSAETGAAPAWRLFRHFVPRAKIVVVQRGIDEIIASFARSEISEIAVVDEEKLRKIVIYNDRCLREISKQPGVVTVGFEDLENMAVCRSVFEHCLPYEFDETWYRNISAHNIQSDVRGIVSYYHEYIDAISRFKKDGKRELLSLVRAGVISRREDAHNAVD